ncbi:TonB-dependent receptor [Chryseobacterium elymi]|nr:TonB-dependent receptor [Chryseobacterium elymi]
MKFLLFKSGRKLGNQLNLKFVFIFLISINFVEAQYTISGRILTEEDEPVKDAQVEIRNLEYHISEWKISDSSGQYQFINIPGSYLINVVAKGYRSYRSDTIRVDAQTPVLVKDINLNSGVTSIQAVHINIRKPNIQTDKGQLIFNVADSGLASGLNGFELLKKIPGIGIGQNDEILFRGGVGVNIMIDGRMTYLSGPQLSNYLKGLSAEDIDKIEINTTPGAEFDAAGNAGIVNFKLKKSKKKEFSLDLRSSVSKSRFWKFNENINAAFKSEKLLFYGSLDYNTPHSFSRGSNGNTINIDGSVQELTRENEKTFKVNYYTWKAGAVWQFLPKHNLAVDYHGYYDDFKSIRLSEVSFSKPGAENAYLFSSNTVKEPYHYDSVALTYRYDIDSSGKKITADANYTIYRNFSDGLMISSFKLTENNVDTQLRSHQPGTIKIKSFKTDTELPFTNFKLKAGLKWAEVNNDNKFVYTNFTEGTWEIDPGMSNNFSYSEKIGAAYVTANKDFETTSVIIGVRVEYTEANGEFLQNIPNYKLHYTKLFPSLSVEQKMGDNHKMNVSLSRRINRPAYADLNPVKWFVDPYFYFTGNPHLVPEIAWVYQVNYSFKKKYIFSLAYNQSKNYINRRLVIDDMQSIMSRSDNFGDYRRFDLTFSAPVKLTSFWNTQFFIDLNHTSYPISMIDGDKLFNLYGINGSLQNNFQLPAGISANLQMTYYSSEPRGIYKTAPTGFIDIGISKAFFHKKLDVTFSANDIFNSNRYKGVSQSNIVDYHYNDRPYGQNFGITLKYHIGKELAKSSSSKTEEQERL